jgi:NitT/TauT family transport system permease protein
VTSGTLHTDVSRRLRWPRWIADRAPVLIMVLVLLVVWYVAAIPMNMTLVRDAFEREDTAYTVMDLVAGTLDAERPLLPAPHQIVLQFIDLVFGYPPDSPRSLVYHSWVTLSATLTGFAIGTAFGILLAVLIVHVRVLAPTPTIP